MSQHRFPSIDPDVLTQWKSSLDSAFREFVQAHGDTIENVFSPLLQYLLWSEDIFMNSPWYLVLIGILAVTWVASRSPKVMLITASILCLIGWIGLWSVTMQTVSLVVASIVIIFLLGIVIGIAMSQSTIMARAVTPVLDIMQTMPSYVYLIPVVMILGLGRTAGVIAIVVFSIPPVIRFVNLGIRQIDQSLIDAADAFGCSRWKKIFYIQLPLAMPTIMAGVNQSVMLALSIVVIAAMIGVPGLGQPVLQAITAQYFTMGLLNGLAIVGLAVIFDKITQSYGIRLQKHLDHKK